MRHLSKAWILTTLLSLTTQSWAQDGKTGYQFLNIPVSTHSAALGGANISIVEDDASMMWTNAAMLTNVTDNSLVLGYNSYIHSSNVFSAGYVKAIGERGTWALSAQMLDYGKMDETDENGNVLGTFSAKDLNFQTSYSYLLSDRWSGAITAKVIMSNYAEYSSTAIGADLALNYFDEEKGFSFSAVGRNLGGQIKSLYDDGNKESLPFNLAFGLSKDFANAPLRVSLTLDDMTQWNNVKFMEHLVLGMDILPSNSTWIALGYNFRRANEMEVQKSSHWAGFSIGAGLNVKKFKVGVAYGKYHVAASSILLNVGVGF
ncbi:MAG: type IX secretion system protein PorQ [Bacteroidaceae bacterium]|nr:type IX secretion system protein PorQ [Bacteroidaceae bacterium]